MEMTGLMRRRQADERGTEIPIPERRSLALEERQEEEALGPGRYPPGKPRGA